MPDQDLRIALYINQFFGQIGGEEAAGAGPSLVTEPVGPGRALVGLLAPNETLAGTIICGDNYFAENAEQATAEIMALLRPLGAHLLLAGPAFNAGRYGTSCGALCKAALAEGIPAVTGMYGENPGVDLYHGDVLILRTGDNARQMRDDLGRMLTLGRKLVAEAPVGRPHEAGYFPQGRLVPELAGKTSAARATDMLMAKLRGEPYASEVQLPVFRPPAAPAPIRDLAHATIALVTDGGLVPLGNPDNIEGRASTRWGAYSVEGKARLDANDYEISHGGHDPRYILADPHRLVGLDVARELEQEGAFGQLHAKFLSTGGLSNPVDNSKRLGQEMARYLKEAGVDGVILTSTWGTSTRCGAVITTELERAGIPTVQVCTMTPVAEMVGSNRIVTGSGIVHPLGNAEATPDEERTVRRRILESALKSLTQPGGRRSAHPE